MGKMISFKNVKAGDIFKTVRHGGIATAKTDAYETEDWSGKKYWEVKTIRHYRDGRTYDKGSEHMSAYTKVELLEEVDHS